MVVLSEPDVDDDLSLFDGREPFDIEHLILECPIEAFIVSVFPRVSWIDLNRFDAILHEPCLEVTGNKL